MISPIILPYKEFFPKISKSAFIAPSCSIIGNVEIGEDSGIWFGSVIRGDVMPIIIGKRTNIQDGSVIHVTRETGPTNIGDNVTVGHKCLIHAATIQSNAFIGMGSIIMDGVTIESFGWVAAGSLVTSEKTVKSGEIWAGSPAKFFRKLTDEDIKKINLSADNYVKHVKEYT